MNELTIEKLINHHRNAEDYERMLHAANEGEEHKHFADFHRDAAKLLEKLHDKHWSECRQIALYDDQIKRMQDHIDRLKGIIDGLCGYIAEQTP